MTAEEYDSLTAEEKRIEVAKACGWERLAIRQVDLECLPYNEYEEIKDLSGQKPRKPDCIHIYDRVPDYLNDLNACHEMEKKLEGPAYYHYYALLACLCMHEERGRHPTSATAEQRCEAFVLTMSNEE